MRNISLRANVIASYFSQFYSAGVGIIILPLYIKIMGAEAYGLVGFFSTLQAAFMLLDMGITPTVSRQTSRYRAGEISAFSYRQLYRSLALMYFVIAAIGAASIFSLSHSITSNWLNFTVLKPEDVVYSIKVIAIIVALRWLCGLNKGVISGNENLVWFAFFNVAISTMRFVLVIPVLLYVNNSVVTFFTYQFFVSLLENVVLYLKSHALLPDIGGKMADLKWSFSPLKPVLKFALSIAFTSSLWVVAVQADKTIMSAFLSLEDYGYFILAVSLASGIMMLSSPITSAILPRMAKLSISGNDDEVKSIYFKSTKANLLIAAPVCIFIAVFSDIILKFWTGSEVISERVSFVLSLYALGYCFLLFSSFPYYLQYAKGNLSLHMRGSLLYVVVLLISLIAFVSYLGMDGAGFAWLLTNIIYFFLWVPFIHKVFLPGFNARWQILLISTFSLLFIVMYLIRYFTLRLFD